MKRIRRQFQRILRRIAYFSPGGRTVRPTLQKWRGVSIGKNVWISQNVYIDEVHPEAVSIGENVTIGLGTSIFAHFYWGPVRDSNHASPVTIEPFVFVGPHCVILPGVTIGRGSVIQAGTVVSRSVPPNVFFGSASPQILAEATVPLTSEHGYAKFVSGLRPLKRPNGQGQSG